MLLASLQGCPSRTIHVEAMAAASCAGSHWVFADSTDLTQDPQTSIIWAAWSVLLMLLSLLLGLQHFKGLRTRGGAGLQDEELGPESMRCILVGPNCHRSTFCVLGCGLA